MARRAGMDVSDLSRVMEGYIAEGLASEGRKYWERIICKGEKPTPAELLDFLYIKYEIEIEGFI